MEDKNLDLGKFIRRARKTKDELESKSETNMKDSCGRPLKLLSVHVVVPNLLGLRLCNLCYYIPFPT